MKNRHEEPLIEEAQRIIGAIGPLEIIFTPTAERTARIQSAIDMYYDCETASDYEYVFAEAYRVLGLMARDINTGAILRPYRAHKIAQANTNEDGGLVLRSIRRFYEAMRYRLGERIQYRDVEGETDKNENVCENQDKLLMDSFQVNEVSVYEVNELGQEVKYVLAEDGEFYQTDDEPRTLYAMADITEMRLLQTELEVIVSWNEHQVEKKKYLLGQREWDAEDFAFHEYVAAQTEKAMPVEQRVLSDLEYGKVLGQLELLRYMDTGEWEEFAKN